MAKKTKSKQPVGSCPLCWQYHDWSTSASVIVSDNPNIILVVETLEPRATRLLKSYCDRIGARPIIIPMSVCSPDRVPSLVEAKRNRALVLEPLLGLHSALPVVAFGLAAAYVAGGKCTETSMVNKSYLMYDRVCAFTYSYSYYLSSRNKYQLQHIESTLKSSLVAPLVGIDDVLQNHWLEGGFKNVVIDVETTNKTLPWYNSQLLQLGIRDIDSGTMFAFRPEEILDEDRKQLEQVRLVVGHNILFDLVHLGFHGIRFPSAKIHDTLIYEKNAHPNELFYGLKPIAKQRFGFPHWEAWASTQLQKKSPLNEDWNKLCVYNGHDLLATHKLYESQKARITSFDLEMDYLKYVVQMVMNGFHFDRLAVEKMLAEKMIELEQVQMEARTEFGLGVDFNFNSPPQVLTWLQRELPRIKSTGEEVIAEYEGKYSCVDKLLKIRDLAKLTGTGLEGLLERLDSFDNVHSSFAVHGAETGRSSSSDPNLQNTDPRVRGFAVSRYNNGRLVHTDLSGIEYRLIGHASQDKNLLYVFNGGLDIHDEMYLALFGEYPPNKQLRKKAKTANFCGVYGGGYKKFLLSAELPDCEESKRLFEVVSRRYPGVAKWKEQIIKTLYRTRRITNLFGRVRTFDCIDRDIEREAINWIIQSSGHDILKIYCMELNDRIKFANLTDSLFVSEVHDSNTFDCPENQYQQVFDIVNSLADNLNPLIEEMYGVVMRVPIIAEVEVMEKWA